MSNLIKTTIFTPISRWSRAHWNCFKWLRRGPERSEKSLFKPFQSLKIVLVILDPKTGWLRLWPPKKRFRVYLYFFETCSRVHFQDFNTFWFYSKTWDLILGVRRLNHPILGSKISKTIFKLWNGLESDFSDRSRPRRNLLNHFQCARDHSVMEGNIEVLVKLGIN